MVLLLGGSLAAQHHYCFYVVAMMALGFRLKDMWCPRVGIRCQRVHVGWAFSGSGVGVWQGHVVIMCVGGYFGSINGVLDYIMETWCFWVGLWLVTRCFNLGKGFRVSDGVLVLLNRYFAWWFWQSKKHGFLTAHPARYTNCIQHWYKVVLHFNSINSCP